MVREAKLRGLHNKQRQQLKGYLRIAAGRGDQVNTDDLQLAAKLAKMSAKPSSLTRGMCAPERGAGTSCRRVCSSRCQAHALPKGRALTFPQVPPTILQRQAGEGLPLGHLAGKNRAPKKSDLPLSPNSRPHRKNAPPSRRRSGVTSRKQCRAVEGGVGQAELPRGGQRGREGGGHAVAQAQLRARQAVGGRALFCERAVSIYSQSCFALRLAQAKRDKMNAEVRVRDACAPFACRTPARSHAFASSRVCDCLMPRPGRDRRWRRSTEKRFSTKRRMMAAKLVEGEAALAIACRGRGSTRGAIDLLFVAQASRSRSCGLHTPRFATTSPPGFRRRVTLGALELLLPSLISVVLGSARRSGGASACSTRIRQASPPSEESTSCRGLSGPLWCAKSPQAS